MTGSADVMSVPPGPSQPRYLRLSTGSIPRIMSACPAGIRLL